MLSDCAISWHLLCRGCCCSVLRIAAEVFLDDRNTSGQPHRLVRAFKPHVWSGGLIADSTLIAALVASEGCGSGEAPLHIPS